MLDGDNFSPQYVVTRSVQNVVGIRVIAFSFNP